MEPTTLYLLYKLHNGPESVRSFAFDSVAECEMFQKGIPKDVKVIRYSCEKYTLGLEPPRWYMIHFDQNKIIHGVPLDLRYMPPTSFP